MVPLWTNIGFLCVHTKKLYLNGPGLSSFNQISKKVSPKVMQLYPLHSSTSKGHAHSDISIIKYQWCFQYWRKCSRLLPCGVPHKAQIK